METGRDGKYIFRDDVAFDRREIVVALFRHNRGSLRGRLSLAELRAKETHQTEFLSWVLSWIGGAERLV